MQRVLNNQAVLAECKIYRMLSEHGKKPHISFHTPGHKNAEWDITELSYSDNLSSPTGCIKAAEEDIANILGAEKSFLLTDGSTSGVLSMLYAAKRLGVKNIAVCDGSHKSVFNGCKMLGLTPKIYPQRKRGNIPFPYTMYELSCEFSHILDDVQALFLTSPDYYGNIADLQGAREYCNKTGKLLIVDGAHGGHLHFDRDKYAGQYADMWVDGVHKSLPAYTQGAVVSAKERCVEALQSAVDIFRTTSPSYPIMASIEYAVKFPQNTVLETEVATFCKQNPDRIYQNGDWTKLCAVFGEVAFAVEKQLQSEGIYPEFCDGNVLTFYLSAVTGLQDFDTLKHRLTALFKQYPINVENKQENSVQRVPAPLVLNKNKGEWIEISLAKGRVCAQNCGLFPPCTPILFDGDIVTEKEIDLFMAADNVFGLENGKILVYKQEKMI